MSPTCSVSSGRYTSKDLVVQYLPCGLAANHVQHLRFNSGVTGGTFKLRVQGKLTAAITFNATIATLLSSINTALDAVTPAPADLVATGTLVTDVTITAAANKFWEILIEADALTGNTSTDPNVTTDVTTQGSKLYTLSSQISKFSYELTTDTVEVTAISEYEATDLPVKESMKFDASFFDADEEWLWAVRGGNRGILYIYPTGKITGHKYFAFYALFDKVSPTFPDHQVVEKQISGRRQGKMVVPFDATF